jgi:hypothetical protein
LEKIMRDAFRGSGFAILFGALLMAMPAEAHAPAGAAADRTDRIAAGDAVGSIRRDVSTKQVCDCRPARKVRTVRKVRRVYHTHTYAFYPRPVWGPVYYYVEPPVRQPLFPYEPFLPARYW